MPDEEWLEESLLKKLDRDDQRELPLLEELLLLLQLVLVCTAGSVPGGGGSQFCRGIIVYAVVPTASVPITRSATWPERFTGSLAGNGNGCGRRGRRLPNCLLEGLSAISIDHAGGVEQSRRE
ncbi:hypothetical protein GGD66_008133 [Bradyrhizobium sp. CIR48]|nr:hypothetical protein [Bradyrhizobium sp. CIR48]